MKDNFNKALKFTLVHEGGFVDDPDDPGGMTNLGISFTFLKGVNPALGDVNDDGVVDEHDIEEMTVDQAAKIYKAAFWDACRCDDLPYPLDCIVFDTGVNMGTRTAIKLMQRTLNYAYDSRLEEDGRFGPKTKAIVDKIVSRNNFARDYLHFRRNYYTSLVNQKPKFEKFLKGWLNRVNDLKVFIGDDPNDIQEK